MQAITVKDTILKLKMPGANFATLGARQEFVRMLSAIIEAGRTGFQPYNPNESDTRYWVFDAGNDWRVFFLEGSSDTIQISYRYQCEQVQAEEALFGWLAYRLKAQKLAD